MKKVRDILLLLAMIISLGSGLYMSQIQFEHTHEVERQRDELQKALVVETNYMTEFRDSLALHQTERIICDTIYLPKYVEPKKQPPNVQVWTNLNNRSEEFLKLDYYLLQLQEREDVAMVNYYRTRNYSNRVDYYDLEYREIAIAIRDSISAFVNHPIELRLGYDKRVDLISVSLSKER